MRFNSLQARATTLEKKLPWPMRASCCSAAPNRSADTTGAWPTLRTNATPCRSASQACNRSIEALSDQVGLYRAQREGARLYKDAARRSTPMPRSPTACARWKRHGPAKRANRRSRTSRPPCAARKWRARWAEGTLKPPRVAQGDARGDDAAAHAGGPPEPTPAARGQRRLGTLGRPAAGGDTFPPRPEPNRGAIDLPQCGAAPVRAVSYAPRRGPSICRYGSIASTAICRRPCKRLPDHARDHREAFNHAFAAHAGNSTAKSASYLLSGGNVSADLFAS